jgi:SH3 domain protein
MLKRALLLLVLLPTMGFAAHITDKLLVGMYAKPSNEGQPLQLLPSGVPVELKGEQGAFVKVELVDGKVGWVEKRFLSDEKPANVRLLALQSKYRQLQNKLDLIEADGKKDADAAPIKKSEQSLALALAEAKTTIQQLKDKQLVEKAQLDVAPVSQEVQNKKIEEKESSSSIYSWLFSFVLLVIGLFVGIKTGMLIQDKKQMKRHGGFRI